MTIEPQLIHTIMINVHMGVGNHGHFIRSFAEAYCVADPENRGLLEATALRIIEKYHLTQPQYLKEK